MGCWFDYVVSKVLREVLYGVFNERLKN